MKSFWRSARVQAAGVTSGLLLGAAAIASEHSAENWPHWRGPHDNGSADVGTYPRAWDAERVLWKAPMPGKGCSTPVVWNRRVYLTAPVNGLDAALAFDWSGKALWQKTFGPETAGNHPNASGSNASAATDGRGLYVYFKSGALAALELDWGALHVTLHDAADGKLLWDCGGFDAEAKPNWPTVASVVVANDVAIVPFGRADQGQGRLHGIKVGANGNAPGGRRIWERERTGTFVPTPVVGNGGLAEVTDVDGASQKKRFYRVILGR